ncbi:c-type cytochrome [Runella sp.]|uniref:c-type cytochrome n=1 Tax=Runella sp. TaxID=1960881 RepID=UPI0030186F33
MTPAGPEPDPQRLLSGHPAGDPLPPITDKHITAPGQWVLFSPDLTAAVDPWGTTFASNLTPDDTGIGPWTEAQFLKAIREGKSKGMDGTRPLLPPMPWMNIAKMTDEDLKAIFAYLKSLPPVKNVVPNPIAAGM